MIKTTEQKSRLIWYGFGVVSGVLGYWLFEQAYSLITETGQLDDEVVDLMAGNDLEDD